MYHPKLSLFMSPLSEWALSSAEAEAPPSHEFYPTNNDIIVFGGSGQRFSSFQRSQLGLQSEKWSYLATVIKTATITELRKVRYWLPELIIFSLKKKDIKASLNSHPMTLHPSIKKNYEKEIENSMNEERKKWGWIARRMSRRTKSRLPDLRCVMRIYLF